MRVNAVRQVVAALAAVALALAACTPGATTGPTAGGAATSGGGATAGAASGGGGAGSVEVTLREFEVLAQPASATAGEVTFEVTNDGPEDEHELVVIKTDLDPGDLPTDTNGAVDEEGDGIEVIDEVEEIPVGESESLTVDLEAGSYVLICNIFEDSENESHYQMGMRTAFDVQ
jgi:uncharacterized cupredoxin-like copper-binding protein